MKIELRKLSDIQAVPRQSPQQIPPLPNLPQSAAHILAVDCSFFVASPAAIAAA